MKSRAYSSVSQLMSQGLEVAGTKTTRESSRDSGYRERHFPQIKAGTPDRGLHATVTRSKRVIYKSRKATAHENSYKNDEFSVRARKTPGHSTVHDVAYVGHRNGAT